jgi:chromate reductase, NAD(P)H dehydrogenase (quinone)
MMPAFRRWSDYPRIRQESRHMNVNILALCGSSRKGSLNQKLLEIAVLGAIDAGAQITRISLRDLRLPIYEGDWEAEHGVPEAAQSVKALIAEHHGMLIATPEHNGGYTALLKNALDWASRPTTSDPSGLAVFEGKTAALISASPGLLGGMRSQIALQVVLNKIGVLVIPKSFALGAAHKAFDEQGRLTDAGADKSARDVGKSLVDVAAGLLKRSDSAAGLSFSPGLAPTPILGGQHDARADGMQVGSAAYGLDGKHRNDRQQLTRKDTP